MSYTHYDTLMAEIDDRVATVYLSRPEKHNAFNEVLITELTDIFVRLGLDSDVKIIVLTGNGKSFCAGADLNWMKKMKDYSFQENYEDAYKLFEMVHAIYICPKPTIAMVNGSSFGGGNGLLCACDIAISSTEALFSLSEVKLGLAPAVISPYVTMKIGVGYAREFMLTGKRIDAETAYRIGLVNAIAKPEELQWEVDKQISLLKAAGPDALKMCKEMIHRIAEMDEEKLGKYNAELIARLRMSKEGQEGISAFFDKRKPDWA